MRDGTRRLAPARVGEQAPLQILSKRGVSFRVDLAAIALAFELREALAIQRHVRIVESLATGGAAAHQRGHDQQQGGQDHERGEGPEEEHREPLKMADPRRARSMAANLSGRPCTGKDSMPVHPSRKFHRFTAADTDPAASSLRESVKFSG